MERIMVRKTAKNTPARKRGRDNISLAIGIGAERGARRGAGRVGGGAHCEHR